MSVIQSLYKSFGSVVVAPDTGVVLQNRGAYFNTDPTHPNCFAPGKRPFHTLIACVVTKGDEPVLGYSNMGGDGQAMFHTQSLTNALDYGMEIQEAIERPRFVAGPIDLGDVADQVRIESRVPAATREALGRIGHNVTPVSDYLHAHGPRPRHHPDQRHAARRRGSPRRRRRDRLLMAPGSRARSWPGSRSPGCSWGRRARGPRSGAASSPASPPSSRSARATARRARRRAPRSRATTPSSGSSRTRGRRAASSA